jgi:hypothetical protein
MASPKSGFSRSIIRFLESVHLAQWVVERVASLLDHTGRWQVIASGFAASLAAAVAVLLQSPHWAAVLLFFLVLSVVLFFRLPGSRESTEAHLELGLEPADELQKEYDACRAELQQAHAGLAQAGKAIDGFQAADVFRGQLAQLSGTVWLLKKRAREIKLAWPDADFNKRPMSLPSWIPAPDSNRPCPWLHLATEWRIDMLRLSYVNQHSEAHRGMMDFDEVMEMLDDAERLASGYKPLRTIFYSGSPDVQVTRWGVRDTGDHLQWDFGFFLRNQGGSANHIAVSPPVRIGDYNLASQVRVQPLLNEHAEVHLTASLTSVSDTHLSLVPNTLADMFSKSSANGNGVLVPPVLRLVYQDVNGQWYVSKHEIINTVEANGDKSLMIAYRYRELLIMPPWMPNVS